MSDGTAGVERPGPPDMSPRPDGCVNADTSLSSSARAAVARVDARDGHTPTEESAPPRESRHERHAAVNPTAPTDHA